HLSGGLPLRRSGVGRLPRRPLCPRGLLRGRLRRRLRTGAGLLRGGRLPPRPGLLVRGGGFLRPLAPATPPPAPATGTAPLARGGFLRLVGRRGRVGRLLGGGLRGLDGFLRLR